MRQRLDSVSFFYLDALILRILYACITHANTPFCVPCYILCVRALYKFHCAGFENFFPKGKVPPKRKSDKSKSPNSASDATNSEEEDSSSESSSTTAEKKTKKHADDNTDNVFEQFAKRAQQGGGRRRWRWRREQEGQLRKRGAESR